MTDEPTQTTTPLVRRRVPMSGWIMVILVGFGLYWIVDSSPSFKDCVRDHKNDAAYHQLHEDGAISSRVARLHLQTVCIEDWTEHYQGGIGAVATLMVAAFTFTLWRATKRLWRSAEDQLTEFRRSLNTAENHAAHMANSVTEAAKTATAMQSLAESFAKNVEIVKAVSEINRGIAVQQKLISELQSRAYISIAFHTAFPQNIERNVRFEARIQIMNDGNTPAYRLRFRASAEVLPHPLRADFPFPLPDIVATGSVSTVSPRHHKIIQAVVPKMYSGEESMQIMTGLGQRLHVWGEVTYFDVFGTERFVHFCHSITWIGDTPMSYDTARYNEEN
jgi:hypothetical protein